MKDGDGRLAQREDGARKIWKEYFEDLYVCMIAGLRACIHAFIRL